MNMIVESNIRDYEVKFLSDLQDVERLAGTENVFFIVDRNVYDLYPVLANYLEGARLFLFDAEENNKTLEYAGQVYDFLIQFSAKKNITIVSIGGGITQDVTGFIAS